MPLWWQSILTILLSGVSSALIAAFRANKADQKAKKLAYLEAQLQKVYGPVYLHLLESQRLIVIYNKYYKAWEHGSEKLFHLLDTDGASSRTDQLHSDLGVAFGVVKEIMGELKAKDKAVLSILQENAAHIDVGDLELIMDLFEDVTRHTLETGDEPNTSKVSAEIRALIRESDQWTRPSLFDRVRDRYLAKSEEFMELAGNKRKTKVL